jgi:hypothetical protein
LTILCLATFLTIFHELIWSPWSRLTWILLRKGFSPFHREVVCRIIRLHICMEKEPSPVCMYVGRNIVWLTRVSWYNMCVCTYWFLPLRSLVKIGFSY